MTKSPISFFARLALVLLLSLILNSQDASAQHQWQHTEICEDCIPVNSYFRDSLRGVAMVKIASSFLPSYRLFSTQDGGKSWTQPALSGMQKDRYHDVAIDPQGDIFYVSLAGNPLLLVGLPDSNKWEITSLKYVFYEMQWQDRMHGMGVGREDFLGGINLMLTDDGGQHWYSLREDRYVEGYGVIDARLIIGGMLVAYQKSDTVIVERSIDSGRTWTSDTAYTNSVGNKAFAGPLSPSSQPNRYHLILQKKDTLDYISTSNNGETWQQHNLTGGRMHRIYEPSLGNLWAIVGRTYINTLPHLPSLLGNKNGSIYMADTLYYSTNAGASWEKDLTFANDTIADMHWPDAEHGFVVSYRDNKVKVSRLVSKAGVKRDEATTELQVWPNPSMDGMFWVTGGIEGSCSVEVTDLAGRVVLSEEARNLRGQNYKIKLKPELPAGVYYLKINSDQGSQYTKLLVK